MKLFILALLVSFGLLASSQESLGDVARRNRSEKKRSATRVITNDQMPSRTPEAAPAQPEAAAQADSVVPSAPGHKKFTQTEVQAKIDELKLHEGEQEIIITKFENELKDPHLSESTRAIYESTLAKSRALHASIAKEREVLERALKSVQHSEKADKPAQPQQEAQGESGEPSAAPAEGESRSPSR